MDSFKRILFIINRAAWREMVHSTFHHWPGNTCCDFSSWQVGDYWSELAKNECGELGTTQIIEANVEGSLINIVCFLTSMVPQDQSHLPLPRHWYHQLLPISNSYMSHAQGINNCQVYISKPAFIGSMFILISWTWSHSNFLFSPAAWKIDSEKMHTQWGLDRRDQRCDLWDEVHLLRGFLLHGFKQLYQSIWHTSPHTWPYDLFCIWWAHPVMQ